jgi:hypothetical protein
LLLAIWTLRACWYSWFDINRFILILATSLCVWELSVVGSDYLTFSLLSLCALLILQVEPISYPRVALVTLFIGFLATFRLPFLLLPPLLGLSLLSRFPHRAIAVMSVGSAICPAFLTMNPDYYPPLELLRAETADAFTPAGLALATAACITAIGLMLANLRRWHTVTHVAVGLSVPWAIVALAYLLRADSLADWKGASFFVISMPYVILAVITGDEERYQQPRSSALQVAGNNSASVAHHVCDERADNWLSSPLLL